MTSLTDVTHVTVVSGAGVTGVAPRHVSVVRVTAVVPIKASSEITEQGKVSELRQNIT